MKRSLLDVNVLLALFDRDHADHRLARAFLDAEIRYGWASCALTQNGFVRVISQPRYPSPIPSSEAIDRLAGATSTEHHEFWPCDISLLDDGLIERDRIHGPKQVTDIYLLALATVRNGRFVTFDRSIPRNAVPAAKEENLVVL